MKTIYTAILFYLFAAFIHSQTEWYKYPGNPVLSPGPESWDIGEVSSSSIIFDGTTYKMWYMGGTSANFNNRIGYATSTDGINWTKYSGNPVLTPGSTGSFDAGALGTPSVIFEDSVYKMWYAGSMTSSITQLRIGYAISSDGINWERQNNGEPVLNLGSAGEWDDYFVTQPTVIRDGSFLKMWYHGRRSSTNTNGIGYATSLDGINWIKYDDPSTQNAPYAESDPVLVSDPGTWDAPFVLQPCVILNNSTFEMWYSSFNGTILRIGYAASTNGIVWEKHPDPVLPDPDVFAPSVIYNGSFYKMWYTEWPISSNRRINYAATDSSGIPTSVELESFSADAFSLEQNYPNPFNPTTTISWQSPAGSWQTLKVYDLLGREVATLVDEFKPSGRYDIEFNASNLSSGMYLYQLKAGELVETKKILLLK